MLHKIKTWCRRILWKLKGSPVIEYDGFCCGLCGTWVKKAFTVNSYESLGKRWDTISMCNSCKAESMSIKNKKKDTKRVGEYSSIHQKQARLSSGNTLIAKKFLRKLDKQNDTSKIGETK